MRIACEIPAFVDRLPIRTYVRTRRIKKREREGGTRGRRGVIKKRANVRDGLDASSCTRQEEEEEKEESPREKRSSGKQKKKRKEKEKKQKYEERKKKKGKDRERNEWEKRSPRACSFLVASIHVSSVTRVMSVGNTRFLESNGASAISLAYSILSVAQLAAPLSPVFIFRRFYPSARRTSPRYLLWPVRAYVHGK